MDGERLSVLLQCLDEPDTQDRHRRLTDLSCSTVSHDWLWRISPVHGPIVPKGDFQEAVRLRLGAPCVDEDCVCRRCGARLDEAGSHALCCALPEATRGHYAVRDAVLPLAHLADPAAVTEARGLIPSVPALRPADILTSAALPGRLAALDIGITSPDASDAGLDCCAAMHNRKRRDYNPFLDELEIQQGIAYRPMVWSTWGREHPETTAMLVSLARTAARRVGLQDHRLLLRRTRAAVGVELMRRAVRMMRACLPDEATAANLLLFAADAGRAPG